MARRHPPGGGGEETPRKPTTTVLRSFTGDGRVTSAPVTANGGSVYALRASTGEVVTTVNVGSAVRAPDEHDVSQPLLEMAIGLGRPVVPGTNTLTVYGD